MSGIAQSQIVGTTLERSVILNLEISEGFPSHKMIGELKRTVFY